MREASGRAGTMHGPWQIGTDTGGTFTDTVVVAADGARFIGKALTTHGALMDGVMDSIGRAADSMEIGRATLLAGASLLSHGTTVGLNALLTGSGAAVGLLTTRGFEATLPMARSNKLHGLSEEEITDALRWRKPALLVPRRRIAGIAERIDAAGTVIDPLDEDQARAAIRRLVAGGAQSLAIALLWSPVNPAHEERLAALAAEEAPDLPVTLSSAIAPRIGEYERTVTTVLNAYVAPLVTDYLTRLDTAIRAEGFAGRFVAMTMGGGVRRVETITRAPVHLLQSGPVGGITAARALGRRLGHGDIIATDVGGTSFDVGLVVAGELPRASRPRIDRHALAVPVIDIASIGTGGGSIASIDPALGALRVGPESAGSMPGPACYGRGGTRPTVTDAAVVLGHVERLGSAIALDRAAARQAVATIAEPLGLDIEAAAEGILAVACAQMADLVRRATIQRGHDPRRFALYGYGGAAPQYIGRYALDLGVEAVVIPRLGPAFSAWGATCSDLAIERETDLPPRPFRLPLDDLGETFGRLEAEARGELGQGGEPVIERRVGLRFARQIHRIDIALPPGPIDEETVRAAEAEFRSRYERIVGRGASGSAGSVEIVAVGVEARIAATPQPVPRTTISGTARSVRQRSAWFDGAEQPVPVHDWDGLEIDTPIDGPAFVESEQTTVVVHPGTRVAADADGNLLLTPMPMAAGILPLRAGGRA